ncbi:hypothetical protein [Nostoc sp.]
MVYSIKTADAIASVQTHRFAHKGLDGVVEPDDARHLPEGSDRLQA